MWRWSCGELPAAAIFVRAQVLGEATSHLARMVPPPQPIHGSLFPTPTVPDLSGTRSLWPWSFGTRQAASVPYLLETRTVVAGALISLSHPRRQRHQVKQNFIGLVDVWVITQLLSKTEGHWMIFIVICVHHIKWIWIEYSIENSAIKPMYMLTCECATE